MLERQETKFEEEKQRILQLSEISLWLNNYEDIFSDFDSRPYHERALSEDFLNETRRASRDKDMDGISLKFLVPKIQRNLQHEQLIKRRLHEHFKKHHERLHYENYKVVRQGAIFLLLGVILMFIATNIIIKYPKDDPVITFFTFLFEPGSWFFFWEGLNLIFFEPKKLTSELEFYHKMSRCSVSFMSY